MTNFSFSTMYYNGEEEVIKMFILKWIEAFFKVLWEFVWREFKREVLLQKV